ncbi:MAG: stage II sporulation protein R [Clostridia bacterium]|nr:stage II sporulation protein R [Clostridia bacterium]
MKNINFFRLAIVTATLYLCFSVITYAKTAQQNIADSVLRLHIVANSNSEKDQSLKLIVRDSILEKAGLLFDSSSSLSDSEKIARENLNYIEEIAKETLKKQGCFAPVRAEIKDEAFPVKFYGDIILPSGKYRAVKITIGEGAGENWWCVMYPPMCNIENLTMESGKDKLKDALKSDEYRMISSSSFPCQIRFKIVDLVNSLL